MPMRQVHHATGPIFAFFFFFFFVFSAFDGCLSLFDYFVSFISLSFMNSFSRLSSIFADGFSFDFARFLQLSSRFSAGFFDAWPLSSTRFHAAFNEVFDAASLSCRHFHFLSPPHEFRFRHFLRSCRRFRASTVFHCFNSHDTAFISSTAIS